MKNRPLDLTGDIIAFENGELDGSEVLALFASLVKTGLAWTLQGSYGRTASDFIRGGYLSQSGKILREID